jgi:predicted O-methyltransferase YrrM
MMCKKRFRSSLVICCLVLLSLGATLAGAAEGTGKGDGTYTFTTDWFSDNIPIWTETLAELKGKPNLNYLEIGVYEGRSFFWVMDNILTDPSARATAIDTFDIYLGHDPEKVFYDNLRRSGHESKVTVIKGSSRDKLRGLRPNSFDLIYVDGDHSSKSVLMDVVFAWDLLKEGGLIIFDDYDWPHPIPMEMRPAFALDVFQTLMSDEYQVVVKRYQLILRKAPVPCDKTRGFVQNVATVLDCSRLGPYVYYWKPRKLLDESNGNREVPLSDTESTMIEETLKNRKLGFKLVVEKDGEYEALLSRLKLKDIWVRPRTE